MSKWFKLAFIPGLIWGVNLGFYQGEPTLANEGEKPLTITSGLLQSSQTMEQGVWLAGDHHMHTTASDGSHTMEYDVEHSKAEGLDFIVITNHGSTENLGKIEGEYEELLRLREENPELLIFYGFEWNVPSGEHATFIVQPGEREMAQIRDFMLRFDENTNSNVSTEQDAVRALTYAETMNPKPAVIVNHPSRKGRYSLSELRAYDNAGSVALGFEGAPGHQANPDRGSYPAEEPGSARTYGGYDVMTARVGDYWDTMLSEDRRWFITANSDFHEHYTEGGNDFWPGEYSKTFVYAQEKSYRGVMDALRSGNCFTVHGGLIESFNMQAESGNEAAAMGETLKARKGEDVTIQVTVRDGEMNRNGDDPVLRQVQFISNAGGKPEITEVFDVEGNNREIEMKYTFRDVQGDFFVRVRGSNTTEKEPSEDPHGEDAWSDLWFYSNPIFIEVCVEEEKPEVSEEEVVSEEGEALATRDNWGVLPSCIGCLETIGESTGDMATYVFNVCSCSPCLKAAYDMTTLVVL